MKKNGHHQAGSAPPLLRSAVFLPAQGTAAYDDTALSLGERVDRRGAFTSRAGTGEGSLPLLGSAARARLVLVPDQTNPSPVRLRLGKTPQPDTLSPRERAGCCRAERSRNVYEKKRTPARHRGKAGSADRRFCGPRFSPRLTEKPRTARSAIRATHAAGGEVGEGVD